MMVLKAMARYTLPGLEMIVPHKMQGGRNLPSQPE